MFQDVLVGHRRLSGPDHLLEAKQPLTAHALQIRCTYQPYSYTPYFLHASKYATIFSLGVPSRKLSELPMMKPPPGLAVCIASRATELTTIQTPDAGEMNPYVFLAAGWNALVEIGLAAGIDLDKPVRAKKVGSEFVES